MRDGWDVVGHWVVEYFDGNKWVLKDPSVPDRNSEAHRDHFYSWQVHDLARSNDRIFEEFRDLYQSVDTVQIKEVKRKAGAMKTLVYDAWTLQHGAPMIAKYRISCDDIPLGSTGIVEPQAELFDAYGRDFRDALQEPDLDAVAKLESRLSIGSKK